MRATVVRFGQNKVEIGNSVQYCPIPNCKVRLAVLVRQKMKNIFAAATAVVALLLVSTRGVPDLARTVFAPAKSAVHRGSRSTVYWRFPEATFMHEDDRVIGVVSGK